jgi:hypothetical protein
VIPLDCWHILFLLWYLQTGLTSVKFEIFNFCFLMLWIVKPSKCPKCSVSSILLCPAYYCVQHIIVSCILLCPAYYCVQHIIVSSILLCPAYYCIQHIIVSSILLCPAYYCILQFIVSMLAFNIHLFNFLLWTCCSHIMLLSA